VPVGRAGAVPGASVISRDFTQTGTGTLAVTLLSFGAYTGVPLLVNRALVLGGELLLDLEPGFAFIRA